MSGRSLADGIAVPSTSTGTTRSVRARERSFDFETDVVVGLLEPAAIGVIGDVQPLLADHDQAGCTLAKAGGDSVDEVLAGFELIDVAEDVAITEPALERFVQTAGVSRRVSTSIADED